MSVGHNLPPSEREQEFAKMRDAYRLAERRDALLAAALKLNKPIADDDEAAVVTDQGRQIRDTIAQWDGYREIEGKPHLERKRGVDSYFKSHIEPLSEALAPLREHLAQWNKRKEEELRAITQEPVKVQVRGNYGGLATTTKRWQCTKLDRDQLDLHALRFHLDEEALHKAIRRFIAAGGRELKGATIEEIVSTQFR